MSCDVDQYFDDKRPGALVVVACPFDWHDRLARVRENGVAYAAGVRVRPKRSESTGFEYESSGGSAGNGPVAWPTAEGESVRDGSILWTAKPLSAQSLKASITGSTFPSVTGLTLSGAQDSDLIYSINVGGGEDGKDYVIVHQVELSNGERDEMAGILQVRA